MAGEASLAPRRLVQILPEVFLGADAVTSLDGSRGFLYGEKRHRQVDILGFERAPEGLRGGTTLDILARQRLDRSGIRGWRIVGVAVEAADLEFGEAALLQGLVAGDVVIAAGGAPSAAGARGEPERKPERKKDFRVLVHRGDCFAEVRIPRPVGFRKV